MQVIDQIRVTSKYLERVHYFADAISVIFWKHDNAWYICQGVKVQQVEPTVAAMVLKAVRPQRVIIKTKLINL